jgi:dihydroflavonol-4-reductase
VFHLSPSKCVIVGCDMNRYFVTGATGMVGTALLALLKEKGETDVTVFVLKGDPGVAALPSYVKIKEGDILDKEALLAALKEGMIVLHLAAFISIAGADKAKMFRINYEGTKNVVDAALEKHAKKLVYVSTSHVLGHEKGKTITEAGLALPTDSIGEYEKSKKQATLYVLSKVKDGLDASIVYPSGILGYPDPRLGEITTLIYQFAQGKLTYYVKGGYAFVDVHDVAEGIFQAATKGKPGQGYLLSGGYLSLDDIHEAVRAEVPTLKKGRVIPFFWAYVGLPFIAIHEKIGHHKPLYTYVSLKTVRMDSSFDTSKAQNELGITFTDPRESIRRIVRWLRESQRLK